MSEQEAMTLGNAEIFCMIWPELKDSGVDRRPEVAFSTSFDLNVLGAQSREEGTAKTKPSRRWSSP